MEEDEEFPTLEQAILARLEAKSAHDYQWPRWAAAEEAAEAVKEWLKEAYDQSYGDMDFVIWLADKD